MTTGDRLTWGISTLGKPELDLPGWVALARRWRFAELELRALEGSLDVPAKLAERFGTPEACRAWAQDQAIRVTVLGGSLRLGDDHAGRRDELLALAPWADALGARWLRVFDGVGPYRRWLPADWAVARRQLDWWSEQRRFHGWQADLIVEAHQAWFFPGEHETSAEQLGATRPILFDFGHALRGLGSGDAALAAYAALAPAAERVHVKDVAPAGRAGPRHCVPGQGIAPLGALLELCRQQAQPPVVTFEWERYWERDLPELEVALDALQSRFRGGSHG